MPVTLNMEVKPKTAAQFRAYIALTQNLNDWWGADPLVDHTMVITSIEYHKANGKRPAKWLFSGTLQTRRFQHGPYGSEGWYREPDSVFQKYIARPEVETAIARQFGG